ncbi:helix-turn-helix transcriptional regulator [Actinomadura yumaensis]|uniref:Helix-turn-helix transcriptional regulator n=1 Tax=Actinomadura yumaensis TaxID=111807 RepID=A0ABW2CRV5_9ACTN
MSEESARKDLPGRLLRLLSLLQSRREWSGAELAERLGVTGRTVRRDVERLRALDYPVEGTTGTAGGYRLMSGRNVPPLLLDDDEAVAVAVGLMTGAGGSVAGIEESSMRALAKLERVLPARLRPRLAALGGVTVAVPRRDAPRVDPGVLAALASCCRDRVVVSFGYRSRVEEVSVRRVEPHSLVTMAGRWYLVAYDPGREGWRTFRVDRIEGPSGTHRRFEARELPAEDAAGFLTRSFARASYRYSARVRVALSAERVRAGVFGPVLGEVEDVGAEGCVVRLSADSVELVVQSVLAVAALGADFSVEASEEVAGRVREVAGRLARECGPG